MVEKPGERGSSGGRAVREQRRAGGPDRLTSFKHFVLLPLGSVAFTTAGLALVAGAIANRDAGAFGFALMALGVGVGSVGITIVNTLEHREARAARRSADSSAAASPAAPYAPYAPAAAHAPENPATGARRQRHASGRRPSAGRWHALLAIPAFFGVACWAVGVGFMLFGYGPGHQVGSGPKSGPVWIIAVFVWGGLAALGITVLVKYVRGRREKRR